MYSQPSNQYSRISNLKMEKTDLIIIGSGPGGYRAAAYAATNGLRVVLLEKEEMGGTCLNRGCIPTKTLCHEADVIRTLHRSGVQPAVDFKGAVNRMKGVVESLRQGVESLMSSHKIRVVRGAASFVGKNTVNVETSEGPLTIEADNIIIATGATPAIPPIQGLSESGVMTSDDILRMEKLPESIIIIGAGVIGMEFASILNTFGSKVTVVEFMKECLPGIDQDIAKRFRKSLEKAGVTFAMQAAVKAVCGNVVTYEQKGKSFDIESDTILLATGRCPAVMGLALENAGVEYTAKGITVDDNMRTNVSNIYAIGDVNGKTLLAHAATMQGIKAVNSILGKSDNIRLDVMPAAVFTYPEIASVGITESQAKEQGGYECRKVFYRSNGKALAADETDGLLKLIADSKGRIAGCHVMGTHAADIVQEAASLMALGTTVAQLAEIVHIHPTVGEMLHDAAMAF